MAKKEVSEKLFRLLINPNQTSDAEIYYSQDNIAITIHKEGYYFSLDKEMDSTIEFLKKQHGFIEVK